MPKGKKKRITKKNKKELTPEEIKLQKEYKLLYLIETLVIIVLSIIMILFLTNRTFFKEEYETDNFKIKIPLLYYFVKDDGNVIEFKTLRKTEYNEVYFDNYLNNLDIYKCKDTFYYDTRFNLAIYKVDVEKKFGLKTIKIHYKVEDKDTLCN